MADDNSFMIDDYCLLLRPARHQERGVQAVTRVSSRSAEAELEIHIAIPIA